MSFIEFESSREKEKKRQWEREARAAILEKAKNKYENEKLQEEARRQRGEHKWMLPSVEAKLSSSSSSKKKKKKEKKKKKKSKKKKDSSSSSSDSDENEMWVEKPSTSLPEKCSSTTEKAACDVSSESQEAHNESSKRDGWMEMTSLFKTYSRNEIKERDGTSRKMEKEEERRKKQEADKPGSHARELNPYFKNGGTGLPEEEKSKVSPSPALGMDAAWLRRALQRAKEQAQQENKSLEEIAAQRWGSLEKFNQLLAEAEGRGNKKSGEPWQKQEKWRRNENICRSRERRSRSRERRRTRSRERRRSRSRERKRSRSKERKRSRSRERNRSRSKERKNIKSGEKRSRSRDRNRSKSRERNKDKDRYTERNRRSRSKEKRRSRSRDRERHRKRSESSGSSDSCSDSSSSYSSSSSRERKSHYSKKRSDRYKDNPPPEMNRRTVSGLLKPSADDLPVAKSSVLSSKFCKPQDDLSTVSQSKGVPSSNRGWQKKEYAQENKRFEKPKSVSSSSSSSSSESSDEEPSKETVQEIPTSLPAKSPSESTAVALTDKEMNELAAKIMKAELVGNDGLATKLKKKLEAARTARANAPSGSVAADGQTGSKEEIVVLTRTDARGFSRPVTVSEAKKGKKKPEKMKTHGTDGQRARYFPDDDKYNLKQMFESEKMTTAEDQNSMFNRTAMRNTEKLNEEYDLDDMFMSKAVKKEDSEKQAERDRKNAIQEHQRSQRVLDSCPWCFENKQMAKHLIVALGKKAYLCLPNHESLTPGHCLIVPVHHVMCAVQADEDLWSEVQNFRKSLVKMFNSRDEDCIFFESVKRLRNFPHMVINCIPLPKEIGDMAPIYFKKAIMECEAEWAQNKKLVDLKNRDVRKAVPKGLPYFFVDFAMDPGYAHVIEDEQDFPHNFAQEIVGGMLDLDNNLWRKPRKENFDAQRRKVMEFSRWYKEFDITQDDD